MNEKIILIIFLGDFYKDARCINMVEALLGNNNKIYIINSGSSDSYKKQLLYNIILPSSSNGLKKIIAFNRKAKIIIKQINPHIIIAADLFSLPAACSQSRCRIIYDSREIYSQLPSPKRQKIKQIFWSLFENRYIYRTKHIFVTASSDMEFLKNKYGNLKISVLKNYPSISMKKNCKKHLKNITGIKKDRRIFLYQGVLQYGRGIKTMITLLKYFDNADAVIIGDGDYKQELINFTNASDLIDRVYFINAVPYHELFKYTCGADIGFSLIRPIAISYINALPNKIFEYILCGIPVITSNLPEMQKVLLKHNIGHCVNLDDLDSQINAVNLIFNNRINNLEKIASNNFIWENQNSIFIEAIK